MHIKPVEQIEHTLHNLASPKRGHTFWGLIGVLIVTSILLWTKHGEWLISPNDYMLSSTPDGVKNYMTSAWHVKHDSTYVHYAGMNYPFGEHVLFTDNQPVLSSFMQWWNRNVSDISHQVVGIMNLMLFFSTLLGTGVLYLLLRKLHLPVWYAGAVAIGIAFLSPQHIRFDGHFGLSHIWVLPMLLLLLCRYEERQSRRYQSLLIGILIWFSAQLHFYNFGVSCVFLGFYTLFQIILNHSWRNIWTRLSHLCVMIILPFALLNIWVHWSDYCPDRPANPFGFTTYIGHWEGVFLPYENFPLYQWIDHHITKIRRLDYEAKAYAGMVATLFTFWLVFFRRFRLFDPEWETAAYHRVHKNYLRGLAFAAFATLFFAFGIPFAVRGLEWMADYLGPFRQFRGLGRFTWVFYYAINLLIFYILWNKSQRLEISEKIRKWVAGRSVFVARYLPGAAQWSLALVPLAVLWWEAAYYYKSLPLRLHPNQTQRNVIAAAPDHWLNKVDFGRFQAMMPLPYYHIGSENIWYDLYFPLFQKVQYTAFQTGVPDMGVNMSRSAVSRMVKSMQFALPCYESPALLAELPDNRPIGLMIAPERWEETKKTYEHLVSKAQTVYEGPEMIIMSLIPDSVRIWSEQKALAVAAEMEQYGQINAGHGWRTDKTPLWFAHMRLDSMTNSRHIFQGAGAGEGWISDSTWLWNKPIPKGFYYLSVWIKVDEDMGMNHQINIMEKNQSDGRVVYARSDEVRFNIKYIAQGWALFDIPFEVKEEHSIVGLYLHKAKVNVPFWYDEVLIKDARFTLYRKEAGWLVRNNYWFKLPRE
ncbi:MAG: hypothetical protein SFV22_02880 [Saprospiraceae bacterium]|nr:hypothetical protein [Saprospiraceae bacterium]